MKSPDDGTPQELAEALPASTQPTQRTEELAQEARRFGRSSLAYLVPNLFVRGLSIFLTPLYTRRIDPAGYAIVGVAGSITGALGIILGLALNGCITRLYNEYDRDGRRDVFGTILAISIAFPLVVAGLLYIPGLSGGLEVLPSLHFRPHLELVIWTGVFSVFMPLPMAYYGAAEEPRKVAILTPGAAVVQIAITVLLVVAFNQGALGILRANLIATALGAVVSIVLFARHARFRVALPGAKAALAFSLPLVPHLVGIWALSISDRLILDKDVAAAEVGRYSLGYTLGLLVSMIASSVGQALVPMAMRQLKDPNLAKAVPPLGTYAVLIIVAAGLSIALAAPEALHILAPASYGSAVRFVPWVVLGSVFQGVYLIASIGTWFSMRTKLIPIVTVISAGLNIGINIVFIPRYGAIVAAVSTAICYAVSALLHGLLANSLHRIDWELRRWAALAACALIWYAIGLRLPVLPLPVALFVKAAIVLVAFPATLAVFRFFTPNELARARSLVVRRG